MRDCARNKTAVYYANYIEKQPILDENGDETGDTVDGFTEPVRVRVNISANKGEAYAQPFGNNLEYEKTISSSHPLPFTEGTRIWQQTEPPKGINDGDTADYYVVAVARAQDKSVVYALKQVTKSGARTV